MLVKVQFNAIQMADERLPKLLEALGWEADPVEGEHCFALGVGTDGDHPKVVGNKVIEPFLTLGHRPLKSWTETVPLRHRINAAASELSLTNHAGALELFHLAEEVGD